MTGAKRYTEDTVYFSTLYADALYRRERYIPDPWLRRDWFPHLDRPFPPPFAAVPLLLSLQSGERVFLRTTVLEGANAVTRMERRLFHPPRTASVLWPVDLLRLTDAQRQSCRVSVVHNYRCPRRQEGEQETDQECGGSRECNAGHNENGNQNTPLFALAFHVPENPPVQNLGEYLHRCGKDGWRSEKVRTLARRILLILRDLNRSGYVYHDFHPSRILLDRDGSPTLDYSSLICREQDAASLAPSLFEEYPPEFADPAVRIPGSSVEWKTVAFPDRLSQNHSLCAFLFYLFFGVFPYDGDPLKHLREDTLAGEDGKYYRYSGHRLKFYTYYQAIRPVFIFDDTDRRNALELFHEDDSRRNLWKTCPAGIKDVFLRALAEGNAVRAGGRAEYPGPDEWLAYLGFLR